MSEVNSRDCLCGKPMHEQTEWAGGLGPINTYQWFKCWQCHRLAQRQDHSGEVIYWMQERKFWMEEIERGEEIQPAPLKQEVSA